MKNKFILRLSQVMVFLLLIVQFVYLLQLSKNYNYIKTKLSAVEAERHNIAVSKEYLFGRAILNYGLGDFKSCKIAIKEITDTSQELNQIGEKIIIDIMNEIKSFELRKLLLEFHPNKNLDFILKSDKYTFANNINTSSVIIRNNFIDNDILYFDLAADKNTGCQLKLNIKNIELYDEVERITIFTDDYIVKYKLNSFTRNIYNHNIYQTDFFLSKNLTEKDYYFLSKLHTASKVRIQLGDNIYHLRDKNILQIINILDLFDILSDEYNK